MRANAPTLDDLGYAQLLADVTARISGVDPEWTDHSPTEPGMVLLELLCWLTESAIWRLDQVSPEVLAAMLELLNPRDPDTLLAGLAPAAVEDRLVAAREQLRTPYRAVTADDYRRLLAAEWPARTFTVHPAKNLDDDTDAPGHVSVVAMPAARHWVARLRLAPRARAWVFPVDRPGIVRIAVSGGGVELGAIVDGANESELRHRGAWILVDEPASPRTRTFTLIGPEGRLRARSTIDADGPLTLSIDAAGQRLLDSETAAPPDQDHARCTLLVPAEGTATTLEIRLWTSSAVTFEGNDLHDRSQPFREWHEMSAKTVTSPSFELTLDRAIGLVVCLACREHADRLADELMDFLAPRALLGTRLHFPAVRDVEFSVDATLYLGEGADPVAVHSTALERLERHFRGLDQDGRVRPIREVRTARLVTLLAGIAGVESVEALRVEPSSSKDLLGVLALDPRQVAALATPLVITLKRKRFTDGAWEEVSP